MVTRKVVTISCAYCSQNTATGQPDETVTHLRDRLSDLGWWIDPKHDVDVCPDHLPDNDPHVLPTDAPPVAWPIHCPYCGHQWTITSTNLDP